MRSVARVLRSGLLFLLLASQLVAASDDVHPLTALLELESAGEPRLSPDGSRLAFVRWRVNWMSDSWDGALLLTDVTGRKMVELGKGRNARWSPDSSQLAYFSAQPDGQTKLVLVDAKSMEITRTLLLLSGFPRDIQWSPDGQMISFRMGVPGPDAGWLIDMPKPPEGAVWSPPPRVINRRHYRLDGLGYYNDIYEHLFLVDVTTAESRQLTHGNWHVGAKPAGHDMGSSSSWSADSSQIFFDGVANEDYEKTYGLSNINRLDVATGVVSQVDLPRGFWINPTISPDGKHFGIRGL